MDRTYWMDNHPGEHIAALWPPARIEHLSLPGISRKIGKEDLIAVQRDQTWHLELRQDGVF